MIDKNAKSTGGIDEIKLELSNPEMKCGMMNVGQITIMVGQNGTGKSLINALVFAVSNIANAYILTRSNVDPLAQFTFDNCFDKKLSGEVECKFKNGGNVFVQLDNGIIRNISYTFPEDNKLPMRTVYLSTKYRTFDSIKNYLIMRDMVVTSNPTFVPEQIISEMCKYNKLYDVMFIEMLIMRTPVDVPAELAEAFKKNFQVKHTITEFNYNPKELNFYYRYEEDPNDVVYLTSLSNGYQALFNQFFATSVV